MNGNDPGKEVVDFQKLREEELLDVIRSTVHELQAVADRLETYVADRGYASAGRDSGSNRSG